MSFELHPQLQADTLALGDFELCRVLLINDARYPWLLLVPRCAAVSEIYQLTPAQQHRLLDESSLLAQRLAREFEADKMNVAALGNMVPQLHLHHVVRYRSDNAWPAPVWGKGSAEPYDLFAQESMLHRLHVLFSEHWLTH